MAVEYALSLVVCTKNRAESLERCLRAISAIEQDKGSSLEFILVDNGSTDDTAAVFEAHRASMPFSARYILEEAPGIGNAMNRGYLESNGAIIAFTDDDCYPAPDFHTAALRPFAEPTVGVAGGRILLHDPTDLPITIDESRTLRRYPAGRYVRPGQFNGANLTFRREALDSVGGFDPLFGPGSFMGSGADCDAAARVCLAGWDGIYDPAIVVRHHHGRKPGDLPAISKRYAIGSGGYHMKLLLQERKIFHFLRYLGGIPKRITKQPRSIYWEMFGATRYLSGHTSARASAHHGDSEA